MPLHICICEHTHTHTSQTNKPPMDVGAVKLFYPCHKYLRECQKRKDSFWLVVSEVSDHGQLFHLWTNDKEEHHGRGDMMEESCSPHNIWEEERRMNQDPGVSFGSILDPEHMSSWTLPPCTVEMMYTLSTSGLPNPGCSVSCRRVNLQWPISSN